MKINLLLLITLQFSLFAQNSKSIDLNNTSELVIKKGYEEIKIISSPTNLTVCESAASVFVVNATGDISGYQWKKNGKPIANANSSFYSIQTTSIDDKGVYTVDIYGFHNDTAKSAPAILNVLAKPRVKYHPPYQIKKEGEQARFYVIADGENLRYQWRRNGINLIDAFTEVLIIKNLSKKDTGFYDCVVSNSCGEDTSNTAYCRVDDTLIAPKLISPVETINFDSLWLGEYRDTTIRALYKNVGNEYWESYFTNIDTINFKLIDPKGPIYLVPNDSVDFTFRFKPSYPNYLYDHIGFNCNSGNFPSIKLEGFGLWAKYVVYEDSLVYNLAEPKIKKYFDTITIKNTGNAPYNIKYGIVENASNKIKLQNQNDTIYRISPNEIYRIPIELNTDGYTSDKGYLKIRAEHINEDRYVKIISVPDITAVNELESRIVVSPNPASERLTIDLPNEFALPIYFSICDINGKNVIESSLYSNSSSLDVTNLANGAYYLKIRANDKVFSKKIYIKK